ncbi:hypothetical protein EON63_07185 [archaeon]|nr:MAG: hypothetical protein EON63_07185 [archaeon]
MSICIDSYTNPHHPLHVKAPSPSHQTPSLSLYVHHHTRQIFCIHGGIPRPIPSMHKSEVQAILALPRVISIMPPYEHEEDWMKQV